MGEAAPIKDCALENAWKTAITKPQNLKKKKKLPSHIWWDVDYASYSQVAALQKNYMHPHRLITYSTKIRSLERNIWLQICVNSLGFLPIKISPWETKQSTAAVDRRVVPYRFGPLDWACQVLLGSAGVFLEGCCSQCDRVMLQCLMFCFGNSGSTTYSLLCFCRWARSRGSTKLLRGRMCTLHISRCSYTSGVIIKEVEFFTRLSRQLECLTLGRCRYCHKKRQSTTNRG